MWKSKDIYYISDSTGILIANLGESLLCQFPEISFHEEKFPYVKNVADARKTMDYILEQSRGRRPIIFSTIMDAEVRNVFRSPEVEFFDAFDYFLDPLEACLEAKALRVPGFFMHGPAKSDPLPPTQPRAAALPPESSTAQLPIRGHPRASLR